jgi:hypothetical protein
MNDKEKADRRFFQEAAAIRVTFVPQCVTCKKNIEYRNCKAFKPKPPEYMSNEKQCPEYDKD